MFCFQLSSSDKSFCLGCVIPHQVKMTVLVWFFIRWLFLYGSISDDWSCMVLYQMTVLVWFFIRWLFLSGSLSDDWSCVVLCQMTGLEWFFIRWLVLQLYGSFSDDCFFLLFFFTHTHTQKKKMTGLVWFFISGLILFFF